MKSATKLQNYAPETEATQRRTIEKDLMQSYEANQVNPGRDEKISEIIMKEKVVYKEYTQDKKELTPTQQANLSKTALEAELSLLKLYEGTKFGNQIQHSLQIRGLL